MLADQNIDSAANLSKDLSEVRYRASASAYEVVAQHPELKSLVVRK